MTRGKLHIRKCIVILGSKTIIFSNTMLWRSESIHTRCYTLFEETASHWTFLQPRVPDKMSNFQCTGLSEKLSLTYMASTFCLCLFVFFSFPPFLILSSFHVLSIWATKCLQSKSFLPNTRVKYVHTIPRRKRMVRRCFSYGSVVMNTINSYKGLRIDARTQKVAQTCSSVPGYLMLSPSLYRHLACMWYTYIYENKTPIK